MNLEEYEVAVEEAIETRDLRTWETHDLRLLVKFARRRGYPDRIDELLLSWAGRPVRGKLTKPAAKVELSVPYVKMKQSELFG